jgi:hypothetical protein
MAQKKVQIYLDEDVIDHFNFRRKRLMLTESEFYRNLIMGSYLAQSLDEVQSDLDETLQQLREFKPSQSGNNGIPNEVIRSIFFIEALLKISMNRPEFLKQAQAKADQSINLLKVNKIE